MASAGHTVDILHPYTKLKWRECSELPVRMSDAQAVWLGDKLYVGGGVTMLGSQRNEARLYIYTPTTDTWSHIDTPVYRFALITYQSQLVLVGGVEYVGEGRVGPVTDKLWTLTEHGQWRETLPPMRTKRWGASAVEFAGNILVAGGNDDVEIDTDIVEVYNGHHWAKAQSPHKACRDKKSTVLNGHWYLMGGDRQGKQVYYASLDSLVASCQPSEKPLPSVWKRLPHVPHERSSIAVVGNRLISVGGGVLFGSSSIHAYSPHTQSWGYVGDMPVGRFDTCTAVLPTGELMVIGGSLEPRVHKASFNVSFDSDSHLTMEALSRLEQIGVTSLRELDPYIRPLQSVVGVDLSIDNNSSSLLELWVQGRASLRPTWRHFFWALREIKLNQLADQIKAFLSGVTVEQVATSNLDVSPGIEEREGGEEDNKQDQGVWQLPGVEEYSDTTVSVSSSQGQVIEWSGLKLDIHEGSLPEGCKVHIKSSLAGEYEVPEGSGLVSAVYWVRCEPQCTITKPITVEIPHCSATEDVSKLKIVRAVCSRKHGSYKFKPVGGRFDARTSYGVIEVNHFSGYGVVEEESPDPKRKYYCQPFYRPLSHEHGHEISIIFVWNTAAHISCASHKYSEGGFVAGYHKVIELVGDVIEVAALEVAKWTKVMDGQWEIQPAQPEVTKAELDDFKTGRGVPACVLEARPLCEKFPQLLHKIILKGIKPPHDKIVLSYMPSSNKEPGSQVIPATANGTRRSCWEVLCCYCCSRAESHPSRSADVHGQLSNPQSPFIDRGAPAGYTTQQGYPPVPVSPQHGITSQPYVAMLTRPR